MDSHQAPPIPVSWLGFLLAALYAALAWPVLNSTATSTEVIVISVPLGMSLTSLSIFDIKEFRLPDFITLPLIVVGLIVVVGFGWGEPIWHVAAAGIGYTIFYAIDKIYYLVRGRQGLGLGDAKLFAAAGAWLGLAGLPSVLMWATGTALVGTAIASAAQYRLSATTHIPFGPALALGFWLVWLYGPVI